MDLPDQNNGNDSAVKRGALIIAPLISLGLILFGDFAPENPKITYTLAVAVLMAIWWVTEAVPLAVTALLPVALFPLFGVVDGRTVSSMSLSACIQSLVSGARASRCNQTPDASGSPRRTSSHVRAVAPPRPSSRSPESSGPSC